MIRRILFAVVALGALGVLFYLQHSDSDGSDSAGDVESTEPGYIATNAELIETGDDGHPLYRLNAERIEQPTPQGIIFLTAPKLD
jgi:lipopolysaccharide export system protein LptC